MDRYNLFGFNLTKEKLDKDNINNLRDVYDVNLIVKADEKIKQGKSKIEITKIYEDFSE